VYCYLGTEDTFSRPGNYLLSDPSHLLSYKRRVLKIHLLECFPCVHCLFLNQEFHRSARAAKCSCVLVGPARPRRLRWPWWTKGSGGRWDRHPPLGYNLVISAPRVQDPLQEGKIRCLSPCWVKGTVLGDYSCLKVGFIDRPR
jgi:hypothetical protein